MKTVDDIDATKLAGAIDRREGIRNSFNFLKPMLKRECESKPNDAELGKYFRKLFTK